MIEIKKVLMECINDELSEQKLTQRQASRMTGLTQARFSNISNYKVELFSVDYLIDILKKFGYEIDFITPRGSVQIIISKKKSQKS